MESDLSHFNHFNLTHLHSGENFAFFYLDWAEL